MPLLAKESVFLFHFYTNSVRFPLPGLRSVKFEGRNRPAAIQRNAVESNFAWLPGPLFFLCLPMLGIAGQGSVWIALEIIEIVIWGPGLAGTCLRKLLRLLNHRVRRGENERE